MRLPLNWLREFVDLPVTPEELAERLTLVGFEVEGIELENPDFSGVVVGRVTRVEPHPQADRLRLAEVEDGRATHRVVCGAPNLTAGRLYPFAPLGAVALITLYRHGMKFVEIPVEMNYRREGKSSISAKAGIYYMLKVTLAVLVAVIKRRNGE